MVGAWETRADDDLMDGRPHFKECAARADGFTTGVWNGNELIATTNHLETGAHRCNGAASSDKLPLRRISAAMET